MKTIKYLTFSVALVIGTSCTLELQEDPNAVQPDDVLPSLMLNTMQGSMAALFNGASGNGQLLTRLRNSGASTYNSIFTPQSFDGIWSIAYSNILQDGSQLIAIADANGLARHAGMTRVISAYTLLLLVDIFGDVPYSEALQGSGNFNPNVDDDEVLYDEAISLLNQAIIDLTTPTVAGGGYLNATAPAITDLYYANNYSSWVRAANTLKLKIYLNQRLTDAAGAAAGINAVITDPGGLISTAAQNFVFRYGTNVIDPDARNPQFTANYLAGGGNYMSNWLMWHMFHGYDAIQNGAAGDPRIRFYFYRQTNSNNTDPNNIRCVTAPGFPAHYPQSAGTAILLGNAGALPPGIAYNAALPLSATNPDPGHPAWGRTFCYPSNVGYWGRDHVDPQGIPPDNFLRTAWGVYPAGGKFDANNPASVSATVGMRGAGFQPMMMRSFVDFMFAEAAIYLGIVPPGPNNSALLRFEAGIRNSMNDVHDWSVNGTFGIGATSPNEGAAINAFYPSATFTADVNNYVLSARAAYNAQTINDDRMNYIAREYWIALFGNGVEALNLYRRTGMPSGMQPALNASPGAFPRSFWYPANFANLNRNIEQKADLEELVFWDTGNSSIDF